MSNLAKARALFDATLSNKENASNFVKQLGIKSGTANVYASKFKIEAAKGQPEKVKPQKVKEPKAVRTSKDFTQQSDLDDFFGAMSPEEKESWPEELAAITEYYTNNPVFGASKRRASAE